MEIYGDKNIFAVEYKITDKQKLLGFAKIWFGGYSLGTNEDLIYLKGYLLAGLEDIANSEANDFQFTPNKTSLFKFLLESYKDQNNAEHLKYSIRSFATFCDDFYIFSFCFNDRIYILWKLRNAKTPFFDLNNQSERINMFSIEKTLYLKILEEFKNLIL
ncbi:hypothetical protein [Flavobacterium suzhouense]|uniref:Uncharacterized protein n=1 Tax=Flavobacterium suzhouense TaxID=1529638 RepID=A0ABW5NUZ4_9FLAO